MTNTRNIGFLFMSFCLLLALACKKDRKSGPTVPELTTLLPTAITATTATSGGTIISDGDEAITASGICWSHTNSTPTLSDDTTKSATASGSFTAMLKNLTPNFTYYVRAYATNRMGTGYGDVKQFVTNNAPPTATNIVIDGTPEVNKTLTATYTYTDLEGNLQGSSTFQWYMADDATGTNETAIPGATALTFTIQDAQQGKYIRIGIKPKATAGTLEGEEVKSTFAGAVGEATTVTFMYNNVEVTYGIINSLTGKKWLDRNLGASQVATSINDYLAFGDLFQWGRAADGHQLIIRTASSANGATGITATTSPYQTSNNNTASTDKFIINKNAEGDWRNPQVDTLWQGVGGVNNPCPTGWRIPTKEEWMAEGFSTGTAAYEKLKLTINGMRDFSDGTMVYPEFGFYWSTSIDTDGFSKFSYYIYMDAATFDNYFTNRGNGVACRCIK